MDVTRFDPDSAIEAIRKGNPVEMVFPVLNVSITESIHFVVNHILEKYNRLDLVECVYSSLKELIINGIKANVKHAFFEEHNIDTEDVASLEKGLVEFKKLLQEKSLEEFEKTALKKKLFVRLHLMHSPERIFAIVENNTTISSVEEKRIREKFKSALGYESIADYYMDNLDDTEGQGIGITMIVLMLKGSNIDPHAFTYDLSKEGTTRAKIEIPIIQPPVILREK